MLDLISYFGTWELQVIITLIIIDVLLGLIAALVKKTFSLAKVADFMKGAVIYFVFGFVIVKIIGDQFPQLSFTVVVSFILIVIALLASILKNLGKLGIPVPKT
jgi:phage-related holin